MSDQPQSPRTPTVPVLHCLNLDFLTTDTLNAKNIVKIVLNRFCGGFVSIFTEKTMKTKFGAIIVEGRGKINGFVASKNRAGSYLRTKVTPVNPQTASQQAGRAIITSLSQAWRGLTQAQRDTWNAAVNAWQRTDIFGDLKTPSGFNLWMQLNGKLTKADAGVIPEAPEPISVYAPSVLSVAASEGASTMVITFAATPVPADSVMIVDATGSVPPGVSFVKNKWRRVSNIPAATATGASIKTPYVNTFGAFLQGQSIQFRAAIVSTLTGQQSAWIYYTVDVAA